MRPFKNLWRAKKRKGRTLVFAVEDHSSQLTHAGLLNDIYRQMLKNPERTATMSNAQNHGAKADLIVITVVITTCYGVTKCCLQS